MNNKISLIKFKKYFMFSDFLSLFENYNLINIKKILEEEINE